MSHLNLSCEFISRFKIQITGLVWVFFVVNYYNSVEAQGIHRNLSCNSIHNEKGKCVSLKACPYFVDVLRIRPILKSHLRLLIKLTCDFNESDPKVCCPLEDIKEPKTLKFAKYPPKSEFKEKYCRYEGHKNFHLLPTYEECGWHLPSIRRILGGSVAYKGQFPFMALIAYKNNSKSESRAFYCAGTIINERYILTAAHCMKRINGLTPMEVHLGEHDTALNPECAERFDSECSYVQIYNIEYITPHYGYDYSSRSNFDNDIALIRLDKDIEYDEFIQPVCLPFVVDYGLKNFPRKLETLKNAIVTGWGRIGSDGPISSLLKFATLPVVPNERCEIDYYQYSQVTAFQICAGGLFKVDTCSGDSGGPLLYLHETPSPPYERLIQIGITSYGTSFCGKGVPGVYTRLNTFLTWILDTIVA